MKLTASNDTNYEVAPSGTHVASCVGLHDLGTQSTSFQGKPKRQHKLYLLFELLNEVDGNGNPFMVGKRYTFSSSEKSNLRKDLESWRGKRFDDSDFADGGFELRNILGKPALVTIIQSERDGNTYADIQTVSQLPKGTQAGKPVSEIIYLSLDPDDFEPSTFDKLSDRLKATIASSPEYQALGHSVAAAHHGNGGGVEVHGDDDAPF
jgi:hypothetical protein